MGDTYGIDGHKLDLHVDRVSEWMIRGDTTPIYVEVSPTAQCNHNCSFCALDYANHTIDRIPRQKLIDIGNQLAKLGVRGVMFGGEGEPTLHPDLPETIAHYNDIGLDTAMTTNGSGLDEHFLVEGGEWLKWVKVSVNAGDAATHALVHKSNDWEKVWRNIKEFHGSCLHHHPTLGAQAVVLPENLETLPGLCRRAVQYEMDYVVLKPFSANAYSHNSVGVVEKVRASEVMEECRRMSNPLTQVITRDCAIQSIQGIQGIQYRRCMSVPYFWFYINSKCEVIACSNHMLDKRFNLGSLYTQTLQDIWYSWSGQKREELKAVMRDFDVSTCRKACRMDRVNEWLWKITQPGAHKNFI